MSATANPRDGLPPRAGENSLGWTEAKRVTLATADQPFVLFSGEKISPVTVEYEDYGPADADKVILICHALTGDAHVAGWDRHWRRDNRPWRENAPGWWDNVIGPGKALDTNRYRVICSNVLGSCYGTTGPADVNPATGRPYGLSFPIVTIPGWVKLQKALMDALGVKKLYAVIGGSLGGQQALEWALAYPGFVERTVVLAAAARLSAQGLGFNAVGRFAIMNDPHFNHGDYYDGEPPRAGLAAARMLAHITYLSEESMHQKFGRRLQGHDELRFGFDAEFQVESYLNHQGQKFVQRFDANSYMYITRAMDYYDAAAHWGGGSLVEACRRLDTRMMVVSFSSDWLYPPGECRELAMAVGNTGRPVTYVNVPSAYGHDAFLIQTEEVGDLLRHFLEA
ncbi:MAG: homoserine O-acetyltransferase [Planctomycetes bacterium]|nr:homoserine O-acetyltransferase [Planctomycetota bacterium]